MANLVTLKEYQAIKNEKYSVVKFKDGIRTITMSGLSIVRVVEELTMHVKSPMQILVINEKDVPKRELFIERKIEYYDEYFKMQRNLY